MEKNKFNFSVAALASIKCPEGKALHYVYDLKQRGLALRVSPAGTRTFVFYRKINGRPERKTLGRIDDLKIEQARKMVVSLGSHYATGGDSRGGLLTVSEAVHEAIDNSNASAHSKRSYKHFFNQFDVWRKKFAPRVRHWGDMNSQLLVKYLDP